MKVNFHYYNSETEFLKLKDENVKGVVSFVGTPRPAIYLGKTKYTLGDQDIASIIGGKVPADLVAQLAQIGINKNDITSIKTQLADCAKKSDLTNLATKSEVGSKADKSELTEYAKKSELTGLATKNDLTSLATKSDLTSKADASNVYTKDQIDQKIADVQTGGSVDLSNYVTKTQLRAYATKAEVVDVKNIANGADTKATNAVSTANAAKNQANTNASDIVAIKSQLANVATKEDLRNIDINLFDVVTKLPATGKTNKVYLVPDTTSTDTQNKYIEYAWINSKWEKIGEFAPKVDLSNYYTKTETYVKLGEVKDIAERAEGKADANKASLAGKADKSDLTGLATKSELDQKENKSAVDTLARGITDYMNKTDGELATKVDRSELTNLATKDEVAQAKNFAEHYLELPGVIVVNALPPVMSIINNRPEVDKYKTYAVLDPDSTDPHERYIKYRPVQDKDTSKWRWERIGRCAPTKKEFNTKIAELNGKITQNAHDITVSHSQLIDQIAGIGHSIPKLAAANLNNTTLKITETANNKPNSISVDLAPLVSKNPDVKYVNCNVNISQWTSCTDVSVCRLTNTDPYVINRYIVRSGSKTFPFQIGSARDISAKNKWYSTVTDGYAFYKCEDITIPSTTGYDTLLLVNFLIHTNADYHMNRNNNTNSYILTPYTISRTDRSQIIFNEYTDRGDYSFNPLIFFNSDLSSKVYNVYDPQTNTVYVYSFKPVFK